MSSSERLIKNDLLVVGYSPAVLHAALCADRGGREADFPPQQNQSKFPSKNEIRMSQKVEKQL